MLVRRSFSLDTERDADLLAWIDAQANASAAVRAALRAYSGSSTVTLEMVYQLVRDLDAKLDTGEWIAAGAQTKGVNLDEDADLAAQLDQLGL